jgi:hypothetical protein
MASSRNYLRAESSAVNLTSDFYLKNFYRHNRNAIKVSTRENYNSTELSYEDSRALKLAAAKLSSFNYNEDENGDNIVSTIQAFAETYNNTLDSSSSTDSETYRQNKQLKALTKKYEKELKDLGITIKKDGKLDVNENILKGSSFKEVRKVFHDESDYMKSLRKIAKRMHSTSYDEVYTMMTGCGGRLSITL